jgi:hypothetical protein
MVSLLGGNQRRYRDAERAAGSACRFEWHRGTDFENVDRLSRHALWLREELRTLLIDRHRRVIERLFISLAPNRLCAKAMHDIAQDDQQD